MVMVLMVVMVTVMVMTMKTLLLEEKRILSQTVFDFSLKGNGWVQYVLLALRFVICPSMH